MSNVIYPPLLWYVCAPWKYLRRSVGLNTSQACVEHRLDSVEIKLREGYAVSVVLASAGYPGAFEKGKKITIENVPTGMFLFAVPLHSANGDLPAVQIFHAGTSKNASGIVTWGGRVIVVSAFASSLQEALKLAYQGVEAVQFEGKTFRRDIAHR